MNRIEEFKNQQGEKKVGFLKKHRGEILAAVGAVAATSAVFIFKGRRVDLGCLNLTLRLGRERRLRHDGDGGYLSMSLTNKFTVADLGKVGEELVQKIPDITSDMLVDSLSANFNF